MTETLTVDGLKARLQAEPDLILLDVCTPGEYERVHVPQAKNVPLSRFDPAALTADGIIARNKRIHLLCHSDARSRRAAQILERAGHRRVVVVAGGTSAWVAAGLPVVRGAAQGISRTGIAVGALVLLGVVLAWLAMRSS